MTKSNLSRHLLNLKVLPTSKALKLYITLSSTPTTNCFAPMFKRKLDKHMMKCDDYFLRRFNKSLTNWQWMFKCKKFMIQDKWLYMTCSNNKYMNHDFCQKNCALNWDAYLNGWILRHEIIVCIMKLSLNVPKARLKAGPSEYPWRALHLSRHWARATPEKPKSRSPKLGLPRPWPNPCILEGHLSI